MAANSRDDWGRGAYCFRGLDHLSEIPGLHGDFRQHQILLVWRLRWTTGYCAAAWLTEFLNPQPEVDDGEEDQVRSRL